MKKIFALAVAAVFALSASAQQEKGSWSITPRAGINVSTLSGDGSDIYTSKVGFVGGADVTWQILKPFAVSAGVFYSQMGANLKDVDNTKHSLDYISVPVMAHYYFVKGLAVNAGFQYDFNVSSDFRTTSYSAEPVTLSIPVGLSYEYQNFIVDARYNFGVMNIYDNDKVKENVKNYNRGFQFTVGYKIGL